MIIPVKTSQGSYEIILQRGCLQEAGQHLNLNRKVLIVTDSGVPKAYAETLANHCKTARIFTLPAGEQSKNIDNYTRLLAALVEEGFTRTDCIAAVGGGVVGDLAGFAAASFMRGIDFYNIPTTVLSQVDSSIGGKTAIDFMGLKNIVGAFYPPKKVLIDPDTLKTLPPRQIANGLAEAVKMAATHSVDLFALFARENPLEHLDEIIAQALQIKKAVVEADEREGGLRKVLNFGHTLAHALESVNALEHYYHGECVAVGMLPMCAAPVRAQLQAVLEKLGLPTTLSANADEIVAACRHDKKAAGENITVVYVPQIGIFELKTIPFSQYEDMIRQVL